MRSVLHHAKADFPYKDADEVIVHFSVAEKVPEHMRRTLIYEPFVPQKSAMVDEETSMIRQIRKKDILLSYPYESMEPF